MKQHLHVVIVMARCCKSKRTFGLRLEEREAHRWIADWAFGIEERAALREGYLRNTITGSFDFDPAYPGCPECSAIGLFRCCCGKVACWDGKARLASCPWCGATSEIEGQVHSLDVGIDR